MVRRDKGAVLGAKAGVVTSIIYAVVLILVLLAPGFFQTTIMEGLSGLFVLFPFAFVVAIPIGIFPSLLFGAMTGWLVGQSLMWKKVRSHDEAVRVGLFLCVAIAVLINSVAWTVILFNGTEPQSSVGTYMGFLGIPSLIYVLVGGRVAGHLYDECRGAGFPPKRNTGKHFSL